LLYGSNTLGAVAGALLSTFLLVESLGTRMTLWIACAVNAVVGLAAVRMARTAAPVPVSAPVPTAEKEERDEKKDRRKEKTKRREEPVPSERPAMPARGFVLAA